MKIVTDSGADLPAAEIADLGVTVAPLYINFPEGEVSSSDLTPDQFYDRLAAMAPHIPTTAQPSAGLFADIFNSVATPGEDVLSIHISSGLSGTINAARAGAEHAPGVNVTAVDTLTLSGGQRLQVMAAALAARAGWQKDAILKLLDQVRAATEVVFTLDTLEYLARGGRIGRVQALAGTILHLKPVIHVAKADGKYTSVGKARTMPRAIEIIEEHLLHLYGAETPMWVTVMHGRFVAQAEALADGLRRKLKIARLDQLRVSPVLGVHTGPGIVGAVAIPLSAMAGLV
jgi:DegV family protein with EDD domain